MTDQPTLSERCDATTRSKVARLYGPLMATHPVFGEGFGRGSDPTPEEAFEAGRRLAR